LSLTGIKTTPNFASTTHNGRAHSNAFEERHPKYVEPQHPIVFLPWNSNEFIYQSQKDGFNHLYLYNRQGKQLKQLTSGKWLVKELIGFDEKNKYVFFTSTELSPLQENIYRLDVKSGKRILIGNKEGVHAAILSRSGKYLIDRYSSTSVPRSINLIDIKTNKSINLLTAANPFEGFVMPTIEVGTIKAADEQTDLYYRMVKPSNFDPSLKYPVIVYVYG
jgi:dipeptidyl-peptidase-4